MGGVISDKSKFLVRVIFENYDLVRLVGGLFKFFYIELKSETKR